MEHMLRGIRGAITVKSNSKDEIIAATQKLLREMVLRNSVEVKEIASVIFSVTQDLNAAFPALAARKLGWQNTPLLCTLEISVPGSLPNCIRILLHVNSEKKQEEMVPVYLEEAKQLRSDD